ncbi:hypothetical protein MC862_002244 [Proteus mirabilis]|nr:hypothetical protein [Proteus mirabilis]HEK0657568.1 hypothetical protein [Proteus mirabilis]HEK2073034.1 hypothetical protein [Proteus mirabilis]
MCELLAEKGRYSVVKTQLPRDCESGGIWVVNAKNKQAVFMPNMTNCDFDIEKMPWLFIHSKDMPIFIKVARMQHRVSVKSSYLN